MCLPPFAETRVTPVRFAHIRHFKPLHLKPGAQGTLDLVPDRHIPSHGSDFFAPPPFLCQP